MKISSVSELGSIESGALTAVRSLTSNMVSPEYVWENISAYQSKSIKPNLLLEGSEPMQAQEYNSVRMTYAALISSAVLPDVKTFLNKTNALVDSDDKKDYRLDDIFHAREGIHSLRVVNELYAGLLNATLAKINELSATVASLTSLSANTVRVNNYLSVVTTQAYINGKLAVNEISGSETDVGIKIKAVRSSNKYTLAADTSKFVVSGGKNSVNTPVGTIVPFVGQTNIGNSFLLCDGTLASKGDYPELYSVIGDMFGEGTDKFFRLPNLSDGRYLEGLGTYTDQYGVMHTVGAQLPEALPNVKGYFGVKDEICQQNDVVEGAARSAVQRVSAQNPAQYSTGGEAAIEPTYQQMEFDAARGQVNPDGQWSADGDIVYGKDDQYNRVRPKSLQVHFYIKAMSADSDFNEDKNYYLYNHRHDKDYLSAIPVATETSCGGVYLMTESEAKAIGYAPLMLSSITDRKGNTREVAYVPVKRQILQPDYGSVKHLFTSGSHTGKEFQDTLTAGSGIDSWGYEWNSGEEDCFIQVEFTQGVHTPSLTVQVNGMHVIWQSGTVTQVDGVMIQAQGAMSLVYEKDFAEAYIVSSPFLYIKAGTDVKVNWKPIMHKNCNVTYCPSKFSVYKYALIGANE